MLTVSLEQISGIATPFAISFVTSINTEAIKTSRLFGPEF